MAEIRLANIESYTVSYTPVQAHRMAEIRLANIESNIVFILLFRLKELQELDLPI